MADNFKNAGEYSFWSKEYLKIFEKTLNEDSWHALTGCKLKTVARILDLALIEDEDPDSLTPLHVLIFLNHLKNYPTVRNGSQFFHCGEDYYQDAVRRIYKDLSKSEEWMEMINWKARILDGAVRFSSGVYIQSIIDGFPTFIQKTENCFSGKEGTYCYRYLVIVSLTGRILFWYGPYEGKSNDLTLLDESNFLEENLHDPLEYILGDEIFASRPHMIYVRHNSMFDSEEVQKRNSMLSAWRSKVENVIAQIKNFMFANGTFRGHSMEEHGLLMGIIFGLVYLNWLYREAY